MKPGYRKFGTTADVGVVSFGKDMKDAFERQAAGMFSVMTEMRGVRPILSFDVEAEGGDYESLLVAWLNELLYLRDTKDVLLCRFEINQLDGFRLKAAVCGEAMDEARHVNKSEVKAVTYHMLLVEQTADGVKTRVVYDI
ncbi:MAG: archease [Nitrospirae bacterium]|nr:archease [Nitrospirota bacterium]